MAKKKSGGLASTKGMHCTRFKTVTDRFGRRVKRCAKFSGGRRAAARRPSGRRRRGLKCVRFKRGPSGQRRCAKFR